jgi:hypothetical protein
MAGNHSWMTAEEEQYLKSRDGNQRFTLMSSPRTVSGLFLYLSGSNVSNYSTCQGAKGIPLKDPTFHGESRPKALQKVQITSTLVLRFRFHERFGPDLD